MPKPKPPLTFTEQLLKVAGLYCAAVELSKSRVSTIVFNDGKKLGLIEDGADLATGKFEHAMAWFSGNWPEGTEWPSDVPRPLAS